jgi:hypothetical protein
VVPPPKSASSSAKIPTQGDDHGMFIFYFISTRSRQSIAHFSSSIGQSPSYISHIILERATEKEWTLQESDAIFIVW